MCVVSRPVGLLVRALEVARPVAMRGNKKFPAGISLAGASAKPSNAAAIGAAVAAAICACVLGGLAWLRRRALLGRRGSG